MTKTRLYLYTLFICLLPVFSSHAKNLVDTSANNNTFRNEPVILVLGDSLSAGYGIDQSQGWVSLLGERLQNNRHPYRVFNASISGETSAGGLNRLAELLKKKPEIVIIELGANDGLRGLSLLSLKNNLEKMVSLSMAAGAKVLLVGMKLPPNYGPDYTRGFQETYTVIAKQFHIKLVPFLLSEVASRRELMQADNLHPTSDAQPILLETVWSQLEPLLDRRKNSR